MQASIRFFVTFDDAVESHFSEISRRDSIVILDAIEERLIYQPAVQTRNRKPMRTPNTIGATWELRCGINNRYRVFYDVDEEALVVIVLAVGRKIGNRLLIGSEEFIL